MLKFLEFLYCDRFVEPVTTSIVRKVADICKHFNLAKTSELLRKKAEYARYKIKNGIMDELN